MKKPSKKLTVSPETIRTLQVSELAQVGGAGITFGWWCNKVDVTLSGSVCDAYSKLAC